LIKKTDANKVAIQKSNSDQCDEAKVEQMLSDGFRSLQLDVSNMGSEHWNPLGELIVPGDTVLLKPNLISHAHKLNHDQWKQVITSGQIIAAVLRYVIIALQDQGRVIIADGPQTDSDFDLIVERLGLKKILSVYKDTGVDIQLMDLRQNRWFAKDGVTYNRISLPGDPEGYTNVDLGGASEFCSYELNGRFYGADYDVEETRRFHSNGYHKYVLCKSVLDAEVIINIPKLKTHKKTGVTLSLKNMVGVNGYRNCLPHHTMGTPDEGGDEFPNNSRSSKLQSRAIAIFKKGLVLAGGQGGIWARGIKMIGRRTFGDTQEVIRSGNWYGNDTTWRMVLDLNKILFHFDGSGKSRSKPLRYLTIVDGIVAGDGNGPEAPDPLHAGVLIIGTNPVAVDTVCTTIMGFDYQNIPVISNAWEIRSYSLVDFMASNVKIVSNIVEWHGTFSKLEKAKHLNFKPHFGWKGYIERSAYIPRGTE